MKIGNICLNWKVVAGLGAVALGLFVFQPRVFGAAFPILIVAACPLSMLVMMRGMRRNSTLKSDSQQHPMVSASELGQAPAREKEDLVVHLREELGDIRAEQVRILSQIETIESSSRAIGTGAA